MFRFSKKSCLDKNLAPGVAIIWESKVLSIKRVIILDFPTAIKIFQSLNYEKKFMKGIF